VRGIPSRRCGLPREPITGDRRDHDVEGALHGLRRPWGR
jgi:hypothetical protein